MSTQPRLDFEGYVAARIENARVRGPADSPFCLREGCNKPRGERAKPGQYCSEHCRREASRERAEERRNRGKAISASNHAPDLELARRLALEFLGGLGTLGTCIVSDVRAYAFRGGHKLPWALPWVGSLFQHRWFVATGARRMTTHIQGNARKVNVYALSPEGWAALKEAENSP